MTAELQQALAASELQLLKMQRHPHFLFNTLHGISSLLDTDRETPKAMIVKLSALFRTALEAGRSDPVPLSSELKFVENYLELEKMRFGARTMKWSIEGETQFMVVPQTILQHGDDALELWVRNTVGGKRPRGTGSQPQRSPTLVPASKEKSCES